MKEPDEYTKAVRRLGDEALEEQDKEYVEKIRGRLLGNRLHTNYWVDSDIWKFIGIIDRLKAENEKLKIEIKP